MSVCFVKHGACLHGACLTWHSNQESTASLVLFLGAVPCAARGALRLARRSATLGDVSPWSVVATMLHGLVSAQHALATTSTQHRTVSGFWSVALLCECPRSFPVAACPVH